LKANHCIMQVWQTEKEINMVYIHHRFSEKKTREKKDQRYGVNDIFTVLIYMMCAHHVLLSANSLMTVCCSLLGYVQSGIDDSKRITAILFKWKN
jgi:hypothetical protein